ncbi:MAG: glucosaminidase domain-containing protein [Myxococcota bacterium]|nr:glucosaminidase domain-containing protein [Myxococcota bacterium]
MPNSTFFDAPEHRSAANRRRRNDLWPLITLILSLSWIFACGESANADATCALSGQPLATLETAQSAWEFVEKNQGSLQELQKSGSVPDIQFDRLPSDLNSLPGRRVDLFLSLVLPAALRVNAAILADRKDLIQLSRKSELAGSEKKKLLALAQSYGLESASIPELLKRVDTVPTSLILAQAADESGWGRSRFAIEGNALFGQHTNNPNQPSIEARDANVRLAAFKTLCGSVKAYVANLNSTRAYAPFREIRSELRKKDQPLSGIALVAGLSQYSERGESYLVDLRSIIQHHDLEDLDKARLVGPSRWVRVVHP